MKMPHDSSGADPAGLMADILASSSRLVRGELALARAEAGVAAQRAAVGIGQVVIAGIVGITALNVLAGAAVAALAAAGLGPLWSALIVGLALLVLAGVVVKIGLAQIKAVSDAPARSVGNLSRDVAAVKAGMAHAAA